jgi:hypothetical protein
MSACERWVTHAERYDGEVRVVYPVDGDGFSCKNQSVGKHPEGSKESLNANDVEFVSSIVMFVRTAET